MGRALRYKLFAMFVLLFTLGVSLHNIWLDGSGRISLEALGWDDLLTFVSVPAEPEHKKTVRIVLAAAALPQARPSSGR